MRTAFFATLQELAHADPRIVFITGDLGFGVVGPFAQAFPDRFVNAGVAEQNMCGLAAGMAMTGSVVFTYSIANFPTLRCLEQIRNDICYHKANVKVVAVGGGLAYGALGFSHHATEDLAIMRSLPNLVVAAPGDPVETIAVTRVIAALDGPAYLRLGKAGEAIVHAAPVDLPLGSSLQLRSGDDVSLLVTGAMLPTAVRVADDLDDAGIGVRLVSMPWISPLDEVAVASAGRNARLVVTLEEHSVSGGLGGAVAEVLSASAGHAPLLRVGLPRKPISVVGGQEFLRQQHGLNPEAVTRSILTALKEQG